jgi:hypothetical protein
MSMAASSNLQASSNLHQPASSPSLFDPERDFVDVTAEALSLDAAYKAVHDTSAGAITTFSGITRDNFDGKKASN